MNLKTWWQKSGSFQMATGSNTTLIVVPWKNGGPCTHKSLGAFPSLFTPTNKSYFPVKKKKKHSLAFSDLAYGRGRVGWTWVYKIKLYIIIKLTNCQHRERWNEQGLG